MSKTRTVSRIVISGQMVLTPKFLIGTLEKFHTNDIEYAVERLLEVLDHRSGDPDFEIDPDYEWEPESDFCSAD